MKLKLLRREPKIRMMRKENIGSWGDEDIFLKYFVCIVANVLYYLYGNKSISGRWKTR